MSNYLWVESYKPSTVNDCILPDAVKQTFLQYTNEKEFPNLILAGPAGVGKTSLARALCDDIGTDLLFVNASLDRGIGDIRTTVAQFASCSSLTGEKKVVLLDEADNLTQDSQKALRALIEEFQNHCRFILTCNYPHNIIDAIHSRCNVLDFHIRNPKDLSTLAAQFHKRCSGILKQNQIEFNPKVLAEYIISMAPDWRGILNGLQGNTATGSGYIVNPEYYGIHELIPMGSTRLPNQGGGERGFVDCALTLGVYHPGAHGVIQDVT